MCGISFVAPEGRQVSLRGHTFFWLVRNRSVQPLFLCAAKKKAADGKKTAKGISISPFAIPKTTKKGAAAPFLDYPRGLACAGVYFTLTKRDADASVLNRRGHRKYSASVSIFIRQIFNGHEQNTTHTVYRALRKPDQTAARRAFDGESEAIIRTTERRAFRRDSAISRPAPLSPILFWQDERMGLRRKTHASGAQTKSAAGRGLRPQSVNPQWEQAPLCRPYTAGGTSDGDGAVGLQMILEEGNEHYAAARCRYYSAYGRGRACRPRRAPDIQAARLRVSEVGAGADLEILLLPRAPRLDIAGFDLEIGQIAGAADELTDRNFQIPEQLDGIVPQLLIPVVGVLGLADDDHFLLFELMDAVVAALLQTMAADLLAEAGRIGCERQRQLAFQEGSGR